MKICFTRNNYLSTSPPQHEVFCTVRRCLAVCPCCRSPTTNCHFPHSKHSEICLHGLFMLFFPMYPYHNIFCTTSLYLSPEIILPQTHIALVDTFPLNCTPSTSITIVLNDFSPAMPWGPHYLYNSSMLV